jgi:hypothetical protein
MIFFKPTPRWIEWLVNYAQGRLIIDVGCGDGHLLKTLVVHGYTGIIGVDPYVSEETAFDFIKQRIHLLTFKAEECKLITEHDKSLLVIARPCHNGFVADTLRANAGNEVLYVSNPTNVPTDIPDDFMAVSLNAPPCPEEATYKIVRTGAPY